ncbi:MAG: SpoIIE family protein phosphatase [Ideonella sp.]|nr:SpoIIE family protein phosphatase [Ideonella sp.]
MLQFLKHWWQRWATPRHHHHHHHHPWPGHPPGWPTPGQPDAMAQAPGWLLAWASRASPHHANQDCAGARLLPAATGQAPGLAVALADGVTLAAAGAVAARAVVDYWLAPPPLADDTLRSPWLAGAEAPVAAALRALTPEPGGATGAAAWLDAGGQGWCSRVGDCRVLRAYRQHGRWQVQPLLADQTLGLAHPQHFSDPEHPDAQQPAHFVGCDRLGEPEWVHLALGPQELLILASDGLHASLSAEHWHNRLNWHLDDLPLDAARLKELARDLVSTAHAQGSEDDITVLVVAQDQRGDTA